MSKCIKQDDCSRCFWTRHGIQKKKLRWTEPFLFNSILLSPQVTMESFSSKDMAMQAQKKILSHMANKSMVNMFIDDNSSEIMDELYRVSKEYTGNRTEAQKVIKDMIKIAVKIGVLFRHNRFSTGELGLAQDFKKKLHQGAMTAISFHEVTVKKVFV